MNIINFGYSKHTLIIGYFLEKESKTQHVDITSTSRSK